MSSSTGGSNSEMLPASGQYFPVDPNVGTYTRPLPPISPSSITCVVSPYL